jgi:Ca2+-binding RTX toxin-like protein
VGRQRARRVVQTVDDDLVDAEIAGEEVAEGRIEAGAVGVRRLDDTLIGGSESRGLHGGLFEAFRGGGGSDFIDGGEGEDRVEYDFGAVGPVMVNLAEGRATDGTLSGFAAQFSVDTLSNIESVRATHFSDTLIGGGTHNVGTPYDYEVFEGLEGNDIIDGGAGHDTASYQSAPGAVVVNLATGIAQDGYGTVDTLISIEGAIGSDFNDSLIGGDPVGFTETFRGNAGIDTIDGGAGDDRVSYVQAPDAVHVDLAAGMAIDDGHGTFDNLISINGVRGSAFDDTLLGGNEGFPDLEFFEGGLGDDSIDGGAGFDRADYNRASGGVNVNLGTGAVSGADGNDTLVSIEAVRGSEFQDFLNGGAGDEEFEGDGGADVIDGGAGVDTAVYRHAAGPVVISDIGDGISQSNDGDFLTNIENFEGSGFNDSLAGRSDANLLAGSGGDDTLSGAAGNDTLDGGAGFDFANYFDAAAGVNVNLDFGTAADGQGGTDTLFLIEGAIGSDGFADTLLGGVGDEQLIGAGGNDTLDGGGGDDTLVGGAGADNLQGNSGSDWATYQEFLGGVSVSLAGEFGTSSDGDLLFSVENLLGTNFADTLTGGFGANTILGGSGNDVLDGGADNDVLDGGAGDDVYFVDVPGDVVLDTGGGYDRAHVDEHGAIPHLRERLGRLQAVDAPARPREKVVDRRHAAAARSNAV